jgi:hypothetical protein
MLPIITNRSTMNVGQILLGSIENSGTLQRFQI